MSDFGEPLEPRRLFAAGALDATFGGGDGSVDVRTNAHASWTPSATDAAVDGAGRALVGGVYGGKRNQFSVARLTPGARSTRRSARTASRPCRCR